MLSRIRKGYFTQGQKQTAPCIPSTVLEDIYVQHETLTEICRDITFETFWYKKEQIAQDKPCDNFSGK